MKTRFARIGVASAVALALVAALAGLGPLSSSASSHREAPLVSADPQIDGTDLYAFVSPDDATKVTLISNWIPFEEPAGGPNFYRFATKAYYDINIDNNADAKPDIIYRWVFYNHYNHANSFLYNTNQVTSLTDPDLNFYQTYYLYRINVNAHTTQTLVSPSTGIVAPVDVGAFSMPNYQTDLWDPATIGCGTGCKTFSGPVDDPFFLDLRVFDLVYGGPGTPEAGHDTLKGFNVHTTAIQVPKADLAKAGNASANPIIGVWTTASRQTTKVVHRHHHLVVTHPYVQVSRLGLPLFNEVVVPVGMKDKYNASKPVNDVANWGANILYPELPADIEAVLGVPAPAPPRDDLLALATGLDGLNKPAGSITPSDELRLNMSIAPCTSGCSRLGALDGDTAGFPNGRRLSDDVIDIGVRVLEGALLPQNQHNALADGATDGVDMNSENGGAFGASFPYLLPPTSGSTTSPH